MEIIRVLYDLWNNFFSHIYSRVEWFINERLIDIIPDALDIFTLHTIPRFIIDILDYLAENTQLPENSIFATSLFSIMFGIGIPFIVVYSFVKWLLPTS